MLRSLSALALTILCSASYAADLRLAMPTGETLLFSIPDDWRGQTRPTIPGQPAAGRIVSAVPGQLEILVTPILPTPQTKTPKSRESVRAEVQKAASNAATQAVEKPITVEDLAIPGADGYYFFATDRAPKPNEFKYMLQGQFIIRDLTVVFTALMNGNPKTQTAAALTAIRSVQRQ